MLLKALFKHFEQSKVAKR